MHKSWKQITPSDYAWERDGLAFIKERLPDHEPYRAWANFEFIALDGSINEVDLLALTPAGLFLVEIKSRPGELDGDGGAWRWLHKGRTYVTDNPRLLAERKAKKLKSLIESQRAVKQAKERVPYVHAVVFLSAEELINHLAGPARIGIYQRDREASDGKPARRGILHALIQGLDGEPQRRISRPVAKMLARALEEAGIKESVRMRRVGQYQLTRLLAESEHYQEWAAEHTELSSERRRVRMYLTYGKAPAEAERLQRAARRELQFLQGLDHPGILRALDYLSHDLGPCVVFADQPDAERLDHYLHRHGNQPLAPDLAFSLLRQLGEALQFAHARKLYHRALSPACIYLSLEAGSERVRIGDWSTAERLFESQSRHATATRHPGLWVQDAAAPYLALEGHSEGEADGQSLDIFSLGAIAYHLFTGRKPAASELELQDKLAQNQGLQVTDVINGAGEALQDLVRYATHPDVDQRIESAAQFLRELDAVEEELTRPDNLRVSNPTEARHGESLDGGFLVKKRLGSGASAVTFLVEKNGQQRVLKIAAGPERNAQLEDEAAVLKQLRHQAIIGFHEVINIGGFTALVLDYAAEGTLARRLRQDGPIRMELLERFGDDLLAALVELEDKGISHRDIKPDNIGLAKHRSTGQLRLMLLDFSLARAPADDLKVGTPAYLDPFIHDPGRRRWDDYAERFAAALTLYEMTTGTLPAPAPQDGLPQRLAGELAIDEQRFDPAIREALAAFFRRSLSRDVGRRFDNADDMLQAWRKAFVNAGAVVEAKQAEPALALEQVGPATQVGLLGLSAQALDTLGRLNINDVAALLKLPGNELQRMPGVGTKTRRELREKIDELRTRLGANGEPQPVSLTADDGTPQVYSIDLLFRQILPETSPDPLRRRVLNEYLGRLDVPEPPHGHDKVFWPTAIETAAAIGLSRADTQAQIGKATERWQRNPSITKLRDEIAELLDGNGHILGAVELAEALLLRRGSTQVLPWRARWAQAVTRAAIAAEEAARKEPRWVLRRSGQNIIIADDRQRLGEDLADYAVALGSIADDCATQDPLLLPARVIEKLQAVEPPALPDALSPQRLLRLAAATAQQAALSSRAEFYPRGMDARRALGLAQGALLGARELSIDQLQARIHGRYPAARPLPGRPALDDLVRELDLGLAWDPEKSAYCVPDKWLFTLSGASTRSTSYSDAFLDDAAGVYADDARRSRAFVRQVEIALAERRFLALTVAPRRMAAAAARLTEVFALARVSFDALLLRHVRQICDSMARPPDWNVILRADAAEPNSRDWQNLIRLIQRALPGMAEEISRSPQPVLLTEPGLLARYGLVDSWLQRLRDALLTDYGPPGFIVLIAADEQHSAAVIDQVTVPTGAGSREYARIPRVWVDGRAA